MEEPNEEPLLNEHGLTITPTYLKNSTQSFKWRNLSIVRIDRTRTTIPKFSLMLSTKKSPFVFPFFQTHDPEMAEKIQKVINTVAKRRGARKEIRRPKA